MRRIIQQTMVGDDTLRTLIGDDIATRIIGSTGDHLKFRITDPRNPQVDLDAIAFKQGGKLELLRSGQPFSLLYTVEENHFNGRTTLQLNVKDMKPGVEHVLEPDAAAQPETATT